MATTKKTGTPGEAAACLVGVAVGVSDAITEAHTTLAHEALPLLRAAQNLANCHRVLNSLAAAAHASPALANILHDDVQAWADPLDAWGLGGLDLVTELLRVAVTMLTPLDSRLDEGSFNAARLASDLKGGAA